VTEKSDGHAPAGLDRPIEEQGQRFTLMENSEHLSNVIDRYGVDAHLDAPRLNQAVQVVWLKPVVNGMKGGQRRQRMSADFNGSKVSCRDDDSLSPSYGALQVFQTVGVL
jgi:hypothetical protein